MFRTVVTLAVGVAIGSFALSHDEKSEVKRRVVSESDIAEKINGKDAKATTVELTMERGQSSAPHRHPGRVFGYVIEGEYEWAIDDKPAKVLKAGGAF